MKNRCLLIVFLIVLITSCINAQGRNIFNSLSLTLDFKESFLSRENEKVSGMNSFLGYKINKITLGVCIESQNHFIDNDYARYRASGLGIKYKIQAKSFLLEPYLLTQIMLPERTIYDEYWGYEIGIGFYTNLVPDIGFVTGFEQWLSLDSSLQLYSWYIGARVSLDSIINSISFKLQY